ncbi:NADH-quinone oxidoreductase subunit NuoH [Desulfovibrio gilichinskyi]|uniref:NADH-quinone oxidoreductase subunit H n=1 Tax=Desulfovibrio gilichinskyi TaxID=1519643 RepID=A0A1X7DD69_9BACT|nr:NADH-quinone oxidoreductase subunit NuoH [Desulfovibrio gilichinskyi]SMF13317.1 NADH dehydrogenase subunit H [Desulfovibrio gilichinskyi]
MGTDFLLGLIVLIIKSAVVLLVVLTLAAYLVLFERKLLGRMQLRYGPNRVGPYGLFQLAADGVKLLLKEDLVPDGADKLLFLIAPGILTFTTLTVFALIPFGGEIHLFGHTVPLVIGDTDIGVLIFLALSSIGVYSVALGGWASNNKFSLIGAVRGVAQMISYELPLSLSLVPIFMLAGSLSLVDIVDAQKGYPFILVQPVAALIFFICGLAESKRIPFDIPEGENELQAGFHTEYSGMRFALFFLGEYINMLLLGALMAVFFLGGWHGPWLPGPVWLLLKTAIIPFLLVWTRGTLPRLRYDQLMHFCWKVLMPLALVNIIITGAVMAA